MTALKISAAKVIELADWDAFVKKTYGRPYSFQQQDGCRARGSFPLNVPGETDDEDSPSAIPEVVNGDEIGVNFAAWLARDPKQKIPGQASAWELGLFWERSFYPSIEAVANDLFKRKLLKRGKYIIDIDW